MTKAIATHKTRTGYVSLLAQWGHGKGSDPSREPGFQSLDGEPLLWSDDGDGHYDLWCYSGDKVDAARTVAGFFKGDDNIALLDGDSVEWVRAPADFWLEADGEFQPNLTKYPNAVAY